MVDLVSKLIRERGKVPCCASGEKGSGGTGGKAGGGDAGCGQRDLGVCQSAIHWGVIF